jgi:hypothetical protein
MTGVSISCERVESERRRDERRPDGDRTIVNTGSSKPELGRAAKRARRFDVNARIASRDRFASATPASLATAACEGPRS